MKFFLTALQTMFLLLIAGASAITPKSLFPADSHEQYEEAFKKTVLPFLNSNCVFCHNKTLRTADLQLEDIRTLQTGLENEEIWNKIREKLHRGEMPPKGQPRPDFKTVNTIIRWIDSNPNRGLQSQKPDPGRVTARRLNRSEYNNTIRDLLEVDLRLADDFPVDDEGYGFDNIGDVLSVSPVLMEKYMAAANKIAQAAIVTPLRIKPILEKFLAPREVGGQVTVNSDGSLNIKHRFPAEGEYEFQIKVVDRRYRKSEQEKGLPLPAPAQMTASLNGQQVKVFNVAADKYEQPNYHFQLQIPAGEQRISAKFSSDVREYQLSAYFASDVKEGGKEAERKLFVDSFTILGPRNVKQPALTESHKKIMICGQPEGTYQAECAKIILANLAHRAYRRPLRDGEVDSLLNLVKLANEEGDTFAQGIQLALRAILVSPHFLFRVEKDHSPGNPDNSHEINQYELATRLSYFLWSSMPDKELFLAAKDGNLRNPKVLKRQIRRMLGDLKSKALVQNFAGQWLQLRNLESVSPDPIRFPKFDEELRMAMRRETELLFEAILHEDRSIIDFLDPPFTFLNERLARHYGIKGVMGKNFRLVPIENSQRGGLLTQASILTVSSYPTRTSPVIRGKWLLENILGAPHLEPPPGVPPLDDNKVGINGTLRTQLEQHRSNPACAVCHAKIDPLGFGFENYDATGAWRTHDGKYPIDASGMLPGGEVFSGPSELRAILTNKKKDFTRCLTEKMLTFALGRGLESYDRGAVETIVRRIEAHEYRFSRLVHEIVNSMPFRMRRNKGWTQ